MLKDKSCKRVRVVLGIIPFIIILFVPLIGSLILVSILCTAGIALIFYIPLIYFLGRFMQQILMKNKFLECEKNYLHKISNENIDKLSQSQKVIIKYILQMRSVISQDEIKANLQQAGWQVDEINNAFAIIN